MKLLLIIGLIVALTTGVASHEVVQIDVTAKHDLVDLKNIQIKTYDVVYHGYAEGSDFENTLIEMINDHLAQKGLKFSDEKPDALLQVMVWSASDPNLTQNTSDDRGDWPNIVRSKIESNYSINIPKQDEELTFKDSKMIQLFLVQSPHSEGPSGLIWTAYAVYRGKEADIPVLAPAMIEQLLLEYPEASKLPMRREVSISTH